MIEVELKIPLTEEGIELCNNPDKIIEYMERRVIAQELFRNEYKKVRENN